MIERWSIVFGDLLMMGGFMAFVGFLPLGLGVGLAAIVVGLVGVLFGLCSSEAHVRSYFQVVAIAAGLGLVMAFGASISGAHVLFGVPLNLGSLLLFGLVVAGTFFAGFEPEAVEDHEFATQRF